MPSSISRSRGSGAAACAAGRTHLPLIFVHRRFSSWSVTPGPLCMSWTSPPLVLTATRRVRLQRTRCRENGFLDRQTVSIVFRPVRSASRLRLSSNDRGRFWRAQRRTSAGRWSNHRRVCRLKIRHLRTPGGAAATNGYCNDGLKPRPHPEAGLFSSTGDASRCAGFG